MSSNKRFSLESFPAYALCAMVFLLPVFLIPTALDPLSYGKSLVFYLAVIASLLAWLFTRLQTEALEVPQSSLLLASGGMTVASLVSAVFSSSRTSSFIGSGVEIGTFSFFLSASILIFLVSVFFQSEKRVLAMYLSLFASSVVVFVYQVLHTGFKVRFPGLDFLNGPTSNLIGSWNDFGIFFGFIGIVSLSLFELVRLEKRFKIFVLSLAVISLLAMIAVNLSALWFIFGFFALVLMVYLFSGPALEAADDSVYGSGKNSKGFWRLSLFVILLVVFFTMGNKLVASVVNYLNTNSTDVRPSWTATFDIAKGVYGESVKNVILGSGPNTFVYEWSKFKPAFVNSTVFWGALFASGVGNFPSLAVTMGLLGGVAILAFLILLVYYGGRILSYTKNDLTRGLIFSSYLGAMYLWVFNVFYSPGLWSFVLASVMTGLFVGLLARTEKIKTIKISFMKNQKARFVYVLVVVLLILGSMYSFSILVQKALAEQIFTSGVAAFNKTNDLTKAEAKLNQAVQFDPQDKYFRALSEFYLLKMKNIAERGNVPKERQSVDFQVALGNSIDSAKTAVAVNRVNVANWLQLGRVYENLASIKVPGADGPAVNAYKEAIKLAPNDPSIVLALARLELLAGRIDGAKDYIQQSLKLKPDFVQALYLDSQIEVQQGNLKGAISRSEQIVAINPNDLGALFQLGLLYYQGKNYDGAIAALERAVAINPFYSNARYFLGLAYDVKGKREDAVSQFQKISDLNPDNQEVKKILSNLESGRSALEAVSPPAPAPEQRDTPPVEEESGKNKKNL